jgi:DNA-binding Lrp family transcriptional regulator
MDELTVKEIADSLGIPTETVKSRIKRARIDPVRYVGPTAIYAPEVLEAIRNVPGKGRPKKDKKA